MSANNEYSVIKGGLEVYLKCLSANKEPPTDFTVAMPCTIQKCVAVKISDNLNKPFILENDLVLCCPHEPITNGDMVGVSLRDGSSHLAKYFESNGNVILTFGDPTRNALVVKKEDVLLKVKVVQINRTYLNMTQFANAVETSILDYALKRSDLMVNPYWWFGEKLGYKSKNYLYGLFRDKENFRMPIHDIVFICETTGDYRPLKLLSNILINQ